MITDNPMVGHSNNTEPDSNYLRQLLKQAMQLNGKKHKQIVELKNVISRYEERINQLENAACLWEGLNHWWWITPDLLRELNFTERAELVCSILKMKKGQWLTVERDIGEVTVAGVKATVYISAGSDTVFPLVLIVGSDYHMMSAELEIVPFKVAFHFEIPME